MLFLRFVVGKRLRLEAVGVENRLGGCEGEAVSLEVTLDDLLEEMVQKHGCVGVVVVLA